MEYKVLIKLYLPEIEQNYEFYIPVNKTVSQVALLLNKIVNDITYKVFPIKNSITLINRRNKNKYLNSTLIRDTDIRNGTELIMF